MDLGRSGPGPVKTKPNITETLGLIKVSPENWKGLGLTNVRSSYIFFFFFTGHINVHFFCFKAWGHDSFLYFLPSSDCPNSHLPGQQTRPYLSLLPCLYLSLLPRYHLIFYGRRRGLDFYHVQANIILLPRTKVFMKLPIYLLGIGLFHWSFAIRPIFMFFCYCIVSMMYFVLEFF